MRRLTLVASSVMLAGILIGCTGAAGDVRLFTHGWKIFRTDHWDYGLWHGGGQVVGGHVTRWAFDGRFILIERNVCEYTEDHRRKPTHRLTGVIEYHIQEVAPGDGGAEPDWDAIRGRRHGPFTAAEFAAVRERLGVPAGLTLTAP